MIGYINVYGNFPLLKRINNSGIFQVTFCGFFGGGMWEVFVCLLFDFF